MKTNITTIKKQLKIPKLRFSGFFGEWEERRLGDITNLITKGTTPTSIGFRFEKEGINFIKVENIDSNFNINILKTRKITDECNEALKRSKLKENDILFSIAGTLGRTAIVRKKNLPANTNQALALIRLKDDYSINFVNTYLNLHEIKRYIHRMLSVGAQPNLSLEQVGNIFINFPSLPEQQKIAEFLEIVDEWIENLQSQKESLEVYKKGMMQKIFSQEIRFKDNKEKDFSKWEEKRLGDLGEIITGATPPTVNKEYYGGEIPWITPTDIKDNKNIYTSAKQLTQEGIKRGRFISQNSLLVTCIASIGKNTILRVDGSCNQQINAITLDDKNDVDFLYYLVEKNKNILISFAGAGGMQMLNKTDFASLKFIIPQLSEQQKIADFLTSLDNLIESKQEQVIQVQEWKKGLMQNLFV